MMQMLAAGGLPVMTDSLRTEDASNPRGYYEFEPVKRLAQDSAWFPTARGKAVKIILQLLRATPADVPLKVLLMERPLDEVVSSQFAMLRALRTEPPTTREVLVKTFAKQRETLLAELRKRPNVEIFPVEFHRLVRGDTELIGNIKRFLGAWELDADRMLAAVDPSLYRARGADSGPAVQTPTRLPWQQGTYDGLIVVSVPKSGTNFLSRYLSAVTGWPHRWGRPSRDDASLLAELPERPDAEVARMATHLIQTETDMALLSVDQRPVLFGNRSLVSLEPPPENELGSDHRPKLPYQIIAEHPVRSLPWLLRNPSTCPILHPDDVVREARQLNYGVIFLYRDLRDIANSLAHFLFAGTRFVKFGSLEDAMEVTVHHYAPVLAAAIRTWKNEFSGMILTYEELIQQTRPVFQRIIETFQLPVTKSRLIESSEEFPTFTFRKGGSGDWQNHLTPTQAAHLSSLT